VTPKESPGKDTFHSDEGYLEFEALLQAIGEDELEIVITVVQCKGSRYDV
jgi:hypothetical protein